MEIKNENAFGILAAQMLKALDLGAGEHTLKGVAGPR